MNIIVKYNIDLFRLLNEKIKSTQLDCKTVTLFIDVFGSLANKYRKNVKLIENTSRNLSASNSKWDIIEKLAVITKRNFVGKPDLFIN